MFQLSVFPRYPLCNLPTPLERAVNLERALGDRSPRIWIKRDDLTGLAFGGNKARKLEYLVADATRLGADHLISEGAVQSNHARLTAAAAAKAGMGCTLVLDTRRGADIEGNLFLDYLMGTEVELVPGAADRKTRMADVEERLRANGKTPYLIPTGGSVPLGALGYVRCMVELAAQLLDRGESPERLYFGSGSQGTQAGLMVGAYLLRSPMTIYGIAVEHPQQELQAKAAGLASQTAALLGLDTEFSTDDAKIDDAFVGADYADPTEAGVEAVQLLARTEALFLDHVYTGKAMAALISHVREGRFSPADSVVFLHSGGGPSIFANRQTLLPP